MTEYSPEDSFDMGEYMGSNEDAAAAEEEELRRAGPHEDEPPDAEHLLALAKSHLALGAEGRRRWQGELLKNIPAQIRKLVDFAARMDREMEEAVLMEGDDEWLAALDGPQLGDALSEAERMIRAGRTIKKIVESHLEMDIREHGAIRLGDDGYYVGSTTKRELIDADGFLNWLGTPARISKAVRVNTSNIRIGVVKGYAREAAQPGETVLDLDDDQIAVAQQAVIDTFFEETVEEEQLKKVPESRAKWVAALQSGERR